ncbi:MAG: sulfite exporter TauE/SafE family protein [Phycisphaerae bacterium]|nr:sulfite exporter TauE/SafE family protein [Phycisphaerae bacterium]
MSESLAITAISLGFLHTILGPDHYLPFVAMSRIWHWSLPRTLVITMLCGIGHVLSSAVLGIVGIALGLGLEKLEAVESVRSDLAAWALIAFGLVYLVWGMRAAYRNRPHTHLSIGGGMIVEAHHGPEHAEVHDSASEMPRHASMTPWILFTIFVFGPCEVLIPLLIFPAATGQITSVWWVTFLFGITTIATMIAIVVALLLGVKSLRLRAFERFGHAAAGAVLLSCGLAIKFGL